MKYRLGLVTGATSGIGQATCELLAQKGIDLLISGRNQSELERLQSLLSPQVNVKIIQADLSQEKDRKHLIEQVHINIPDLIINNAGFGLYGEALSYETADQENILEVNCKALLEITMEAARVLISKKKKGVILNISSVAAYYVIPNMSVYAASKAFVNQFSQAFDFEVKKYGVRVLTLCPGMVATQFQSRAGGKIDKIQLGMMTASFIAEKIWDQIERLNSMTIVDWRYRFLTFMSFFLPINWIARKLERVISNRILPRTIKRI